MKLLFATFLAALAQSAHAAKKPHSLQGPVLREANPRVRMPKSAKGQEACDDSDSSSRDGRPYPFSAVYTQTNEPDNEVLVYSRDLDTGELTFENAFSTGGSGALFVAPAAPGADPILNTDSVQVTGECVLVTNAGSHELTSFHIHSASVISFSDRASTDGTFPVSVTTAKNDVVYVLNGGGQGSVQAFNLDPHDCALSPIGRAVPMDQGGPVAPDGPPLNIASPNQIGFTPSGDVIATIGINGGGQNFPGMGSINIFTVKHDGSLDYPVQNESQLPLAFTNDPQGRLLVAAVFPDQFGNLRVFEYGDNNDVTEVDRSIEFGQQGTCWIKYNSRNGCHYLTNTQIDGSVSTVRSTESGVELVDTRAGAPIVGPIDIVVSADGKHVYTLKTGLLELNPAVNDGTPRINVYSTDCDCAMTLIEEVADGFPKPGQHSLATGASPLNGVVGLATFPAPYPLFD